MLSNDLPGVQRQTIASVSNNVALRELHLIGLDKFPDTAFASILPSLPHLRILVLRCGEWFSPHNVLIWPQWMLQSQHKDS